MVGEKIHMKSLYISLILTKRCNAKCSMCNCHMYPTNPQEEFGLDLIEKLPRMKNVTLTGGEPFLRADIEQIVSVLEKKADRVLINTNGYYTDKIVSLCKKYPKVGIRISLDGGEETHNRIRGIDNIYSHVMQTLTEVEAVRGRHDLGVGYCVQDCNYEELIPTYQWAEKHGYEFGFSVVQNSAYFNKDDNDIKSDKGIWEELEKLKRQYLKTLNPKKWARAFFAEGAERYVKNEEKPLKCDAGRSSFFITPYGDVLPCNDFPEEMIMGNLHESTWDEIMNSQKAQEVVFICKNCKLNCWSICNMGSQIHKNAFKVGCWIIKNKVISM